MKRAKVRTDYLGTARNLLDVALHPTPALDRETSLGVAAAAIESELREIAPPGRPAESTPLLRAVSAAYARVLSLLGGPKVRIAEPRPDAIRRAIRLVDSALAARGAA